jgi:hypothetical protein
VIGPEALEKRREEIAAAPELAALAARLRGHLGEVLAHPLYVPEPKALYSRWGAHCRDDGAELGFDPWSPHAHRCTACGRIWSTEQSHRWWVYWYQLWLAERTWMLALEFGLSGEARYENRALATLAELVRRYEAYPSADNVLGPSRPFFSTYLESIWVLHLAAAVSLLEAMGRLPRDLSSGLRARLFAPSAALIADFDEGRSNRQVWNAAALFALGRVLGDDAMQREAARGASGILGVLDAGLLDDGLWYEGENYHWFALRGLAWGADLLREAGVTDLWTDESGPGRKFRAAFRAPTLTVLPDFTFPARRDSRFGVSLRQRRMAELWEMAVGSLQRRRGTEGAVGGRSSADGSGDVAALSSLLRHVYDPSVPCVDEPAGTITEVERTEPPAGVRRDRLGWKGLLWMAPALPTADPAAWTPGTVHLEHSGLAIFRRNGGTTYVGLDYGEPGGGHGHPDRLNLTLHARGAPWLVDFGTGSYASPSLGWYRTTLAHNAPLVDGVSQAAAHGACIAFDERGDYSWVCAQLPEDSAYEGATLQRTVVVTPGYVLDVVQMGSVEGERQLALPWHGWGRVSVDEHGCTVTREEAKLRILLSARQPFQVQLHRAPGPPVAGGEAPELPFAVALSAGEEVTLAACLDLAGEAEELECSGGDYVVRLSGGRVHVHRPTDDGWMIELDRGDPVQLGGVRELPEAPPVAAPQPRAAAATCYGVEGGAPALDGTLAGFPSEPPLLLDQAHQFRRAEEPWPGPDEFSARAWLAHDADTLYVAVDVTAPEPCFRPADEGDPEWENENPDIHSDGLQVYVSTTGFFGWLIVPGADSLRVSAVPGSDAEPEMIAGGSWQPTPRGYRMTFGIVLPEPVTGDIGFDLYVNRAKAGRQRRVGQLVWSGARGSRLYLAGDRPLPGPLPLVRIA